VKAFWLRNRHAANTQPLGTSEEKPTTAVFCCKKTKKKNDIMNSQRTKQHICKPHKLTHNQSLQKSCFLADAPEDNYTFGILI
jgi:hypothetical protein